MPDKTLPSEDALLLSGLKRGEERFYRLLFDKYYQPLVIFANRMLLDMDLSRSTVQDVFVMLFDKREEIVIHTSLNAHLYQTVRNRCLNHLKRDKMKNEHHQIILDKGDTFEQPSTSMELNELEALIQSTIEVLPEQCRRIFKMSRQEGLTNQEIAESLAISKRTVETQISKALKRLREELGRHQLLTHALVTALFLSL
ncbi:RNA polymerase sigma-70 factor [Geofilum rubicundum]|uniref:RNA polymerase ECF-type sigma factor n=1 Tax=Geofilum rubicundum JCM 15548 TaxID=1236989 RepID=A0A0E9M1X0_9BACT|nr:RNA polymerase sigma-70 factor [Geofilum rubicundum]GAO31757.1 RNA polymerase ECF-type sigma factor [Geofilum rubicundum JCM 15548]